MRDESCRAKIFWSTNVVEDVFENSNVCEVSIKSVIDETAMH